MFIYCFKTDDDVEVGIGNDEETISNRFVFEENNLVFAWLVLSIPFHCNFLDHPRLGIAVPNKVGTVFDSGFFDKVPHPFSSKPLLSNKVSRAGSVKNCSRSDNVDEISVRSFASNLDEPAAVLFGLCLLQSVRGSVHTLQIFRCLPLLYPLSDDASHTSKA